MAGQVFTFESSSRHMRAALSNYQQWCANWMFTRHSAWPDNVKFTETSVAEVQSHVTSPVDAVCVHEHVCTCMCMCVCMHGGYVISPTGHVCIVCT